VAERWPHTTAVLTLTVISGAITLAIALFGPQAIQVRAGQPAELPAELRAGAQDLLGPLTRIARNNGVALPDSLAGPVSAGDVAGN
jgi:hypothetical protein